jgi:hypothetical protein
VSTLRRDFYLYGDRIVTALLSLIVLVSVLIAGLS